eukprot:maker-scaffold178_size283195-snap-gene-1.30 protein:Tk10261 transcript:maker-scaffold178_size283195-snap-gene-1.30-mRNA-1 annotation:"AGAP008744-PA"
MVASSASRALPLTASNPALSEASEAMEGEGELLPLRWIPWEVHVMGSWSSQSDVWSFGVTLWEIFTHCQSPPLANLADSQIEENLLHHYHANGFHLLPSIPTGCHKDVVTILNECWQRDPQERPRFSEICTVLKNISPTLKSLPFYSRHLHLYTNPYPSIDVNPLLSLPDPSNDHPAIFIHFNPR